MNGAKLGAPSLAPFTIILLAGQCKRYCPFPCPCFRRKFVAARLANARLTPLPRNPRFPALARRTRLLLSCTGGNSFLPTPSCKIVS